jgi:hypothetical protein
MSITNRRKNLAAQEHYRTRPNCNAYSGAADRSTRVRTFDDIDSLEDLIEIVLKRWPNHRKDDWQLAIYYDALSDLVGECGLVRLKVAVRASLTRCDFFPEPSELRKLLPSIPDVQIQSPEKVHDPGCPDCGGNGWKVVKMLERGQLQNRATRCKCKAPATQQLEPAPDLGQYHSVLKQSVERIEMEHLGSENRRAAARARARAALKTVTERMEQERTAASEKQDPSAEPSDQQTDSTEQQDGMKP